MLFSSSHSLFVCSQPLITFRALVLFTQTTVETILTPLTALWYEFDASWNSLLFTGMVHNILKLPDSNQGWCYSNFLGRNQFSHEKTARQDTTYDRTSHCRFWFVGTTIRINKPGNVLFVVFLVLARHIPHMRIPLYQFCLVTATYIAAIAFYQSILGSLFR